MYSEKILRINILITSAASAFTFFESFAGINLKIYPAVPTSLYGVLQ
jgi:hypothetical protein